MNKPSEALSAFLSSSTARRCKVCKHEHADAISADLRAYFEMRDAGETRVSFKPFAAWLKNEYGLDVYRGTILSHASKCLGIDHGLAGGN
jgi:hypothetical protein